MEVELHSLGSTHLPLLSRTFSGLQTHRPWNSGGMPKLPRPSADGVGLEVEVEVVEQAWVGQMN